MLLELDLQGKVADTHFGRQASPLRCLFCVVLNFGEVFGGCIEIVVIDMEGIVINPLCRVIYPVDSQMCCINRELVQIA